MRINRNKSLGFRVACTRTEPVHQTARGGHHATNGARLLGQYLYPSIAAITHVLAWRSTTLAAPPETGCLSRVRYYPIPGSLTESEELGFRNGVAYRRYRGNVWYRTMAC